MRLYVRHDAYSNHQPDRTQPQYVNMKKNSSLEIFESLNFYLVRLKVRPNPYSNHQPSFKSLKKTKI